MPPSRSSRRRDPTSTSTRRLRHTPASATSSATGPTARPAATPSKPPGTPRATLRDSSASEKAPTTGCRPISLMLPDENRKAKLSCLRHSYSGVGHHAELPVDPSCAGLLLLARVFQPSGCGRGDPLTSRRAVCVGPGLAKIVVECQCLEPRSSTTLSSIVPARARLLTMKVAPRSEIISDANGAAP